MNTTIFLKEAVVKHGIELAVMVYTDKIDFRDKRVMGGGMELLADINGFVAETAICEHFKKSWPSLLEKKLDNGDIELDGKRYDIKCSHDLLVNCEQYRKLKGKIDGFVFCKLGGMREEHRFTILGKQYQVFVPSDNGDAYVEILGKIDYDNVPKFSKIKIFTEDKHEVSRAYKVKVEKLNPVI